MTPAFLQQTLLLLLVVAAVPISVLAIKGLAYFLDPLDADNPLGMESRRSVEAMFAAGWGSPLYRPTLEEVTRRKLCRRPLADVPRWLPVAYLGAVLALAAGMGWICATTLEASIAPVVLGLLAAAATVTVLGLAVDLISSLIRLRAARALSNNFAAARADDAAGEGAPERLSAGDQVEDLAMKAVAVSVAILIFRVLVALADCAAVASFLVQ